MPSSTPIYLDYNATAPIKEGVARAMIAALEIGGNPSSVHRQGRDARRVVEQARTLLSKHTGARPQDIIFTSGGTEANRLALTLCNRPRVLASAVEHASVAAYCAEANALPVDATGRLKLSTQ